MGKRIKNNTAATTKNDSSELLGWFWALCLVGGVGYLAYKKEKMKGTYVLVIGDSRCQEKVENLN